MCREQQLESCFKRKARGIKGTHIIRTKYTELLLKFKQWIKLCTPAGSRNSETNVSPTPKHHDIKIYSNTAAKKLTHSSLQHTVAVNDHLHISIALFPWK